MTDYKDSSWADKGFAENYLDKADVYIPGRGLMFGYVSSLFSYYIARKKVVRLLDLGCGDGILAGELLKGHAAVRATLVDGNESMLAKSRERLKPLGGATYVKATFQDILSGAVVLGKYELCVSSMAIHHLQPQEKAALFRVIYAHLNKGGHFVNCDNVLPPSQELEEWYFEMWKQWMGHEMEKRAVKDETPEDVIKRYKDPLSLNKPDTLAFQLSALKKAGFSDVDCYYKNGAFAVFGGKKAK